MFDGLITKFEPEVALNRPSAKALSHILRHQELWPKGFKWDYTDCRHCAIGLAQRLWRITYLPLSFLWGSATEIGLAVGLPPPVAQHIFFNLARPCGDDRDTRLPVTPEDVADAIDSHLNQKVTGL